MVININEINARHKNQVGSKAYQISRLSTLSYHVCTGYVLTIDFFKSYCEYNNIELSNSDISEQICSGKFDIDLIKILESIFKEVTLHAKAVVVRSSALEEDGIEKSYAGIFESVVDVKSYDCMLLAIKKVWCSCFSEAANEYRENRLQNPTLMAVIIQEMVDCDKAGVAFTRNPVTKKKEIVIEACKGNNADIINNSKKAIRYYINSKVIRDGKQRVLARRELVNLIQTATKLEKDFGYPCDFEWGMKNKKLYIFQVRPITAEHIHDIYTKPKVDDLDCILLDRYAEPATVCYLSLLESWQDRIYLSFYNRKPGVEFDLKPLNFLYNRVYWNVKYQKKYFEDKGNSSLIKKISFSLLIHKGYGNWYKRLPRYMRNIRCFKKKLNQTSNYSSLIDLLDQIIDNFCIFIGKDHFRFLGIAQILYSKLEDICTTAGCDKQQIAWLIGKQTNKNQTVLANNELLDLVQSIDKDENLKLLFSQNESGIVLDEIWSNRDYSAFLERFQGFISKHGHRGIDCDDLYYPHWNEDPSKVISLIKQLYDNHSLLDTDGTDNRDVDKINYKITCVGSQNHIGITRVWKQWTIRHLIKLTSEYMCLRENQRYYFDMSWVLIREILLKLSEYYTIKGVITKKQDIFHMTIDEIKDGIVYSNYMVGGDIIEHRKNNYEQSKTSTPSYIIKNSVNVSVQKAGKFKSYKVMGISGGVAAGRIKIINSLDDLGSVKPKDIAVVKTFHPSWTPVLKVISGLIMNYGNILSHGAVVAREYGIPVVVFNGNAANVFIDGDLVEVNGSTGRIKILE